MNNPLLYAALVRQPRLEQTASANLYAWGDNQYGQLGDGTTTEKLTPTLISAENWLSVSCGTYFTHAIREDGLLFACGLNQFGTLGDGTTTNRATLTQIGSSTWRKVSRGPMRTHTLAIRDDGKLFAWGRNHFGQLGDGTTTDRYSPVQIGTSSWLDVAAGASHSLAIRDDGTLFAWGNNSVGQLGNGTTVSSASPIQIGLQHLGIEPSTWSSVAAGDAHSVAVLVTPITGVLACGRNDYGQLGNATTTTATTLSNVTINVNAPTFSVAAGGDHNVLRTPRDSNSAYTWGRGQQGQLGLSTVNNRTTPQYVKSQIATVSAGAYHSFVIRESGKLEAAGYNLAGQLGDGTSSNRISFVQIGNGNWRSVSGGVLHSFGIASP